MKSKLLFLLLIFVTLTTFDGRAELRLDTYSKVTFLIDAQGSSCAQSAEARLKGTPPKADLAAMSFSIPNPKFTLTATPGPTTQMIKNIKITVQSPRISGGVYTCSIDGAELGATFAKEPQMAWNGEIEMGATVESSTYCPALRCGGVPADATIPFHAVGQVEVFGYDIDHGQTDSTHLLTSVPIDFYFFK